LAIRKLLSHACEMCKKGYVKQDCLNLCKTQF